jgi:glycosyltransferase involved in cell wall biosynthesis
MMLISLFVSCGLLKIQVLTLQQLSSYMRKWIICSGSDWYNPSMSSTKQIGLQFKQDGYRVLWINPVAFKSPFVNSANYRSVWIKIKNKIRIHLCWFRRNSADDWVLVPLYFPVFWKSAEPLNRILVSLQVRICCFLLGIRISRSILWIAGSFTAEPLLEWPFFQKVYEAADLISGFRNASPELKRRLQMREKNLCDRADVVFAASETIAEKLKELCGDKNKVVVLHHGVNYKHFSEPGEIHPQMQAIRDIGRPVAGYFGSLSDANDKAVFKALAQAGFSVVLIGKLLGDYKELEAIPNIFFIGSVDYQILPSYACGFDIGLLNWRMHEWIENCFPIKALEYLAAGVPVISCNIPVLKKYFSEQIMFVDTPQEWVRGARELVKADSKEKRRVRQNAVRNWTWESRYKYITKKCNEIVALPVN